MNKRFIRIFHVAKLKQTGVQARVDFRSRQRINLRYLGNYYLTEPNVLFLHYSQVMLRRSLQHAISIATTRFTIDSTYFCSAV